VPASEWEFLSVDYDLNNYIINDFKSEVDYKFKLVAIFDGVWMESDTKIVTIAISEVNKLYQNYPNPFNPSGAGRSPSTTIEYLINKTGDATIRIYNIRGKLIREYHKYHLEPGKYSYIWDGKDNHNRKITSGVYIYSLNFNKKNIKVRKMVLNK